MILATNNKNKISEIKQILSEYEIKSLSEANVNIEVEEDQDTFFGNASKKAKEIYEVVREPVIADDSGICIDVFDGWPSVMTHRFLGAESTDRDRNLAIIKKMNGLENRKTIFECSLVFFDGENLIEGNGVLNGYIVDKPRGSNGFGFDEIFELSNLDAEHAKLNGKTLAELNAEEKNIVSARYLATLDLKTKLDKIL